MKCSLSPGLSPQALPTCHSILSRSKTSLKTPMVLAKLAGGVTAPVLVSWPTTRPVPRGGCDHCWCLSSPEVLGAPHGTPCTRNAAPRSQNSRSPSHLLGELEASRHSGCVLSSGATSYGEDTCVPQVRLCHADPLSSHGCLLLHIQPRLCLLLRLDSVSSCECVHHPDPSVSVRGNSRRTTLVTVKVTGRGCRRGEDSLLPQVSKLLP